MTEPLLQLDMFGGPAVPFDPGPPPREPAPVPEVVPVPVLAGQLDLLDSRGAKLVALAHLLEDARFAEAATRAQAFAGEAGLAGALGELARTVTTAPGVEGLAALDLTPHLDVIGGLSNASFTSALRRGQAVLVARRLEAEGPLAVAAGETAGHFWLLGGRPLDARRSLEDARRLAPYDVGVLVPLGNVLHLAGEHAGAREAFRQALRAAPEQVVLDRLLDEELASLVEETRELGLEPVAAWLPFVGFARGVFRPSPETFEREPTAADRFAAALLRSRLASSRGRPDVEARRELKRLAPALLALLLEEGLA